MGYEGLQASLWLTVIIYLLISAFFGGVSSWYYQEKIIGDYSIEIIIGSVIFAPIFFIGMISAVWWGLSACITGGIVVGIVISERMSYF